MLKDSKLRSRFCSWLAGECLVVSRKWNRLSVATTLSLKSGGASRSALEQASRSFRYVMFHNHLLLSAVAPPSTAHRTLAKLSGRAAVQFEGEVAADAFPRLQWVDNFAKYYARTSLWSNNEPSTDCLWTAMGYKRLPTVFDMSWRRLPTGETIPAMSNLDAILTKGHLESPHLSSFPCGSSLPPSLSVEM